MTLDIAIVLGIVVVAIILFVTERIAVELTAMFVLTSLLVSGVISLEQGLSGFSSPATIAVGAMFVLSTGLYKSGALNPLGTAFITVGRRRRWLSIAVMMLSIAVVSAFINNTAAMILFLPLALGMARDTGQSPSKLLIPLSFASIFGGTCTLIGTSTNLLIDAIARDQTAIEFGMFEFARLGLIFAGAGILYMLVVGVRLIPERGTEQELTDRFGLRDYLTEVVLMPGAASVGETVVSCPLISELKVQIIDVVRDGQRYPVPPPDFLLREGDVLVVRCGAEGIKKLHDRPGVKLRPHLKWTDEDLSSDKADLVEAVIAPNSMLVGRTMKDIRFRNLFGATVLGFRHGGTLLTEDLADVRLSGGDALLLEVRKGHLSQLRGRRDFVIVSELGLPQFRKGKIVPAVVILAGVVGFATVGVVPIVVSAIAGCALMVLFGCLSLEEAYRAIEWKVVLLLAGIIPLGIAVEQSGIAALISSFLISTVGVWGGAIAVLSLLYLLTSMMTELMSNNATAVLFAPIAIGAATAMGVDPKPFLFAVAFAASASFITPIGYQTNTMIYSAGRYRFSDFARVGIPLNLLFWAIATFFIPIFWPF
jgi:di/tricarboxylate transporter